MHRLTKPTIEQMVLNLAQRKPDSWLTFHPVYLGEVLALQCKGLVTSRLIDGKYELKLKDEVGLCTD